MKRRDFPSDRQVQSNTLKIVKSDIGRLGYGASSLAVLQRSNLRPTVLETGRQAFCKES
jgi:hypothetical protein